MFNRVAGEGEGVLDLVIYNAGNAAMGLLHDMEATAFEASWRVDASAAFLSGGRRIAWQRADNRVE